VLNTTSTPSFPHHTNTMHDNPDRSELVPSHTGPNVLPNSPLFGKLLRHARRERVALRDLGLNVEKTYG
jgi:malonyl-CoA/methylmalonyl-CoA synthetase